jgi:hypothetical protein
MRLLACVFALLLGGCLEFGKVDDAKAPGDMLGVYSVVGHLDDTTCGAGALSAENPWSFDVKLSRYQRDLYWLNGREAIVGSIEKDGRAFSFDTRIEVQVEAPLRGRLGCRISRSDRARGELSASGTDVETFDGTLSFDFSATADSDCVEWMAGEGAVPTLPCSVDYELEGERQSDE